MKRKFTKGLVALCIASMFAGCIKEDFSDCRFGARIHYIYELNKHHENRFGPDVTCMNISVFDANNKFYQNFVIDDPAQLQNDNLISLPVPAGTWTLVSWGGDLATYKQGVFSGASFIEGLQAGQTSLSDFRLMLDYTKEVSAAQVDMTDKVAPLYYGDVTTITTTYDRYTSATIPCTNDVNDLVVKITGLENRDDISADDFEIYATMSNGRYANDNAIATGARTVKYSQPIQIKDGVLTTTLSVLRLMQSSTTEYLTIKSKYIPNANHEFVIPIVPTILKNPAYNTQEDLDREDTYEFIFSINVDASVTITINDWEIVQIIPSQY